MKKLIGPILGAYLVASLPAGAGAQQVPAASSDQAAEMAEAHAIIEIMFPPAARQKMTNDMLSNFMAQFRAGMGDQMPADAGLKAIVDKHLALMVEAQKPLMQKHMPAMLEAMAVAYSNEFSLAELKDIHAFALTPSGGHYLSRSTALIGDPAVAKVNTAMVADSQKMAAEMREALKADLVAYMLAHPESVPKDK